MTTKDITSSFIHQLRGLLIFDIPSTIQIKEEDIADHNQKFENTTITEKEYREKVNYESYFRIVGVPYRASLAFHGKVYDKDIPGAIDSIRPYFEAGNCIHNIRLIKAHLENALSRVNKSAARVYN